MATHTRKDVDDTFAHMVRAATCVACLGLAIASVVTGRLLEAVLFATAFISQAWLWMRDRAQA